MPLGASRLSFLAKTAEAAAETTSDSSIEFRAGDYGYIDALTASSTSNPYSVFMWFYIDSGYGVSNYQFLTESFRNGIHAMRIQIENSKLTCDVRNSSNGAILRGQSTSTISADTWYAVWLSYDPSTTTNRGFYYQEYGSATVNSISFSTNTTGTYQSGYYDTTKDIGIAARGANGAVATRGNIAEFWIDDTMRDFTSSTNRQKFVDSSGNPVDLGSDGSTPFSAQPPIYIAGSNMLTTNRGDDGTTPTYSGSPPLGSAVGTI